MVREIMKYEAFLALPSERATAEDMDTARDLLETLEAHKAGCVGMAANMIGVNKRMIAFDNIRGGGGLPVAHRHAENPPLAVDQGAVSERENADTAQDLHRLDRADHPA